MGRTATWAFVSRTSALVDAGDVRQWLNKLGRICQCCAQGKDAKRPENARRCCAIGQCCHAVLSAESRKDARNILRAALTCAMEEEIITRNPAAVIRLSSRNERTRKRRSWTVDEARQFLESARHDDDVLYTAYVLVLGLRKGELLGLTWDLIDFDRTELYISEQVQRVSGQIVRRQTKTEASDAPLPLPDLCIAALKLRKRQQEADREQAGDAWIDTGLVFTTRHGTPIEPRNFNRSFDRRVAKAKVSKITVHGTRKTSRHAAHCWRPSTSTRVWLCRSCGTARSASRWRFTPRSLRPPPAPR